MSEGRKTWCPAGIYKGVFEGFLVEANRHMAEDGQETAWHTRSYKNSGDYGHREYWVVNGQFRKTLKQTIDMSNTHEQTMDEIISAPPDIERKAILRAIEEWSTREPNVG